MPSSSRETGTTLVSRRGSSWLKEQELGSGCGDPGPPGILASPALPYHSSVVGQQSRRGQQVDPAPEGSTKVTSGLTTCSELGSGA